LIIEINVWVIHPVNGGVLAGLLRGYRTMRMRNDISNHAIM